MSPTLKYGAAAAAVLVVAVVGYSLLSEGPSVGTQSPVPASPSAEPAPTSNGSPVALHEGRLSGGRYLFRASTDTQVLADLHPGVTVTADVPSGWNGWGGQGQAVTGPGEFDSPRVSVVFQVVAGLFRDPCHWDSEGTGQFGQPGNVPVGPAAMDLVNTLQESTSYASTTPSPVLLGGLQGYELEIEFPDDVTLAECDGGIVGGSHHFEIFSGKDVFPYFFEEGDRMRLFIVDVEGTRVIATILSSDASPAAELAAARAIVESVDFTP